MRREIITFIAALLALVLAACAPAARPFTVEDAQTLLDAGAFDGDMMRVESSVVALLYGIDGDKLTDYVSYIAANTASSADEVTVLVLTDEEAAKEAEDACRRRVESQITNCESYCPDAIPSLEAAVIKRVENTVLLAVGNPDRLPAAVGKLK